MMLGLAGGWMKDDLEKHISLKDKFDEIDREIINVVKHGFYQSHFRKNIGMWEYGEAIVHFIPPECTRINFLKLSRETIRDRRTLKSSYNLYQQYPEKQKYIKEYAEPMATKALERYLKTMTVLLSGSTEWWTPKKYIDAVHKVMGDIDLDPASCKEANKTVCAKKYYTIEDNGLRKKWEGRIFLNPPYGNTAMEFIEKFFNDYGSSFHEGIILVNSRATDAGWFQPMFEGVVCFSDHRIDFESPDNKITSSTHGSCFIYFGPNEKIFAEVFNEFGNIIKRWP